MIIVDSNVNITINKRVKRNQINNESLNLFRNDLNYYVNFKKDSKSKQLTKYNHILILMCFELLVGNFLNTSHNNSNILFCL